MSFDAALSRPSLAPGAFASPSRADRRSRARATPRAHADASSRVKRTSKRFSLEARRSSSTPKTSPSACATPRTSLKRLARAITPRSAIDGSSDRDATCAKPRARGDGAEIGPNSFVARWSVEFVPAKMKWLYDLGLNWPLGELRIEKYDILDRRETSSLRSATRARRAVVEREMRIPIAKIEGVSRLTFDDDGKLSRHEETLTLVEMVNAGKVRNKPDHAQRVFGHEKTARGELGGLGHSGRGPRGHLFRSGNATVGRGRDGGFRG